MSKVLLASDEDAFVPVERRLGGFGEHFAGALDSYRDVNALCVREIEACESMDEQIGPAWKDHCLSLAGSEDVLVDSQAPRAKVLDRGSAHDRWDDRLKRLCKRRYARRFG
jgi:hypothetical protein